MRIINLLIYRFLSIDPSFQRETYSQLDIDIDIDVGIRRQIGIYRWICMSRQIHRYHMYESINRWIDRHTDLQTGRPRDKQQERKTYRHNQRSNARHNETKKERQKKKRYLSTDRSTYTSRYLSILSIFRPTYRSVIISIGQSIVTSPSKFAYLSHLIYLSL